MSMVQMHKNFHSIGESHCQRALTYARQYKEEKGEEGDQLCRVLKSFYDLRFVQGNAANTLPLVEEMYDCVAVAYHSAHPKVLEAASSLIDCLCMKGDLEQAEIFAQMTLDSLKDKKNGLDQQSEEVARGYYNVANIIHQQLGDLVKGEMLIRESLRIRTLVHDVNHPYVGITGGLLAHILQSQGKFTDEAKSLFERSIAINIKQYGPDGSNTAVSLANLAHYYCDLQIQPCTPQNRISYLRLARDGFQESVRIYTKNLGRDHPRTMRYSASLLSISTALSTFEHEVNEQFKQYMNL
jgi:tetratricopeptide (TPR) repeat protein